MTKRVHHLTAGLPVLLGLLLIFLAGCGPERPADGAFWPTSTRTPAVVTPVVPATPETTVAALVSDQSPLTATLAFDHASVFALGKHEGAACESCHAGAEGSQVDCETCHKRPAQHLKGADASCYLCHTASGWKPAAYPHSGVKDLGTHTDGFVCGSCHESRDLRAASARCQPCHDRPARHPPVGTGDCARCHEPSAWKPAKYEHKTFASLGKHTGAVCAACHTDGNFTGATVPCQACHATPPGHAPGIATGCPRCHQPGAWSPANVPHAGFLLVGKHVSVACAQCHADSVYAGRPETCSSCHQKPAGHLMGTPSTCDTCHTPAGWKPVSYKHAKFTLVGQHQSVVCASCHADGRFAGRPADCASCHSVPGGHLPGIGSGCERCHSPAGWKPVNVNHSAWTLTGRHSQIACASCHADGKYSDRSTACSSCHTKPSVHMPTSADCSQCHAPSGWRPVSYQHASFQLVGRHQSVACATCHADGRYAGRPSTCESCHTTPAGHIPGITSGCSQCHSPTGWKPANYSHTKFPLIGNHVGVPCSSCHANGVYAGRPNTCESCHSQPSGHLPGLTTGCSRCHSPAGWTPATVNHSKFALTGQHQTVACIRCHANGQYAGRPSTCESCHTTPAGHIPGITSGCSQCHSPTGWKPANYSHTKFPLIGNHVGVPCSSCHANGVYAGRPNTCESCHSQPSGHLPGLTTGCSRCHSPAGWTPATVNHSKFALTGQHQTVACIRCHANGQYTGRPSTCESCHTTPAGHIPGITSGCSQCHSPAGWKPANYSHTKFPLIGNHVGVPCSSCHANGVYAGRPNTCESCHSQPSGHLPGLTTGCSRCHSPAGWTPATVNHSKFALTGQHQTVACIRCHANGVYAGRPSTCESCHTTPAGHIPGITSGCSQCHSPTGWKPANFSHTKFPLTQNHAGVPCASCHANGVYAGRPNTCESCHTQPAGHLPGLTTGCSRCHSPAGWTPANVNHTKWPLVGNHTTVACIRCHANGQYTGRPNTCESCHSTPAGHIPGITSGCSQCHSPTGWKPANFNHSKFALTNKHAGVACASCHKNGVYAGTSPLCQSCHTPPSTHTGMSNLNCASCHATTGFKPSTFVHKPVGEHIGTNPERPLACTKCHPTKFTDRGCVQSGCHSRMP